METASPPKRRKKERAHNQLGLTPRTEEYESSGEEEVSDEEAQLSRALRGESGKPGYIVSATYNPTR
jgi:hypothetical protein